MSDRQTDLSLNVLRFLEERGCTVTMTRMDTEIHIHYTLKLDVKPQPAIRVTSKPSLIIPTGSQMAVVLAFTNWLS